MIGECPSPNREGCPLYDKGRKCRSNTHHLYWPANKYNSPLEKEFRELEENKEQVCIWEHSLIHEEEYPPKKPRTEVMIQAIARAAIGEL